MWCLPRHSHTDIVHSVVLSRSRSLVASAKKSQSAETESSYVYVPLLQKTFKVIYHDDQMCAAFIREQPTHESDDISTT